MKQRGRPRRVADTKSSCRVVFHTTEGERAALVAAARANQQTLAEFVRDVALHEAAEFEAPQNTNDADN